MTRHTSPQLVRSFWQDLVWPVYLVRPPGSDTAIPHWQLLADHPGPAGWRRIEDVDAFEERHYKEFVVFLPHVQRFLYGEGHGRASHLPGDSPGESARKLFRRDDVAAIRFELREGQAPVTLQVKHVDLCFFDDVDVALLNVEVFASDLPLAVVQDLLYRYGRTYPTGWNEKNGQGVHNAFRAEWIGHDGSVLAASDARERERYLEFTRRHRAPAISSHWAFLMQPLVLDAADEDGPLRFRLIEYHRMPMMAYLAIDDPLALSREEWLRLGLVATVHPDEALPVNDPDVVDFEARYCHDRYWAGTPAGPNTRFLCSGRALLMVGKAEPYFLDNRRGMLAQFRHQYFILFLINHFHHAALLVFSDKLVDAIHDLDIRQPESVRRFRRRIRECFETFLRFTHRYWFEELSERPHMQALNHLCARHLRNDRLYLEVKEELRDMSQYLDGEASRRTNRLFMRLNIVTVFSIIGTVATGFLGMNLFALADRPGAERALYFMLALLGVLAVLMVAVMQSRQLSEVMDTLSDDQLPVRERLRGLFGRRPLDD